MYHWTAEMIAFLQDASAASDYYPTLAAAIGASLAPSDRVCDVGCGLGQLSQALAPYVRHVTALDCSAQALSCLTESEKLSVCCADAFALPEQLRFDAMIFCYFGSLRQILPIAARHCTGEVFVVRRNYTHHRFDPGFAQRHSRSVEQELALLAKLHIPCTCSYLSAEFGQPLRSQEAALRFFNLYRRGSQPVEDFGQIADRLQKTGRADFPYYYPQRKQIALLHFPAFLAPEQK